MAKVALIRCETYDYPTVKAAVVRGLELLGGPLAFCRPGETILLKPNLVAGDPPARCTTTHPAVFQAVAEVFLEAGAKITYGDSPGVGSPAGAAKKAGLTDVARKLGLEPADFQAGEEVFFANGVQNKKFIIAKGVLACDGLISLPKLKTHGLMRMTGAIKNQFGCVPGILKGEYHVKLSNVNEFARMLVDLTGLIRPRLFLVDGIIAMEGNGPRGGSPKPLNVLLMSADPVALDATICRIIDLKPEYVPYIVYGQEAGLGTCRPGEIALVGDDIAGFISPDFQVAKQPALMTNRRLTGFLNSLLVQKPYIEADTCVKCGICLQACPVQPKALDWPAPDKAAPPAYNYDRCIKCYCCQEMCPEGAIKLTSPFLRRAILRNRH